MLTISERCDGKALVTTVEVGEKWPVQGRDRLKILSLDGRAEEGWVHIHHSPLQLSRRG